MREYKEETSQQQLLRHSIFTWPQQVLPFNCRVVDGGTIAPSFRGENVELHQLSSHIFSVLIMLDCGILMFLNSDRIFLTFDENMARISQKDLPLYFCHYPIMMP
uniref:Uncharacterized protein n=1 Tax=Ananas comosus var. bracteatus TaxID=296719 RepID=A0A6V7P6V4_ANACO|nr:unnamed protein product [Ananas comosus var. bracteatus]